MRILVCVCVHSVCTGLYKCEKKGRKELRRKNNEKGASVHYMFVYKNKILFN